MKLKELAENDLNIHSTEVFILDWEIENCRVAVLNGNKRIVLD